MDDSDPAKEPVVNESDGGAETPADDDAAASGEAADSRAAEQPVEEAPPEPSVEEQLEQARADLGTMRERMLRVAADFDNYRKRSARDVEDARRRGVQSAVRELLPVFDNLERATAHVDESSDVASLIDGLRMVHKLFLDTLAKMGIERVAGPGNAFDPAVHEGIQHEHSDEHPAGVVSNELQPGYRMGGDLVRPALVVVSRGPRPAEEPAGDETAAEGASDEEERTAEASAGETGG